VLRVGLLATYLRERDRHDQDTRRCAWCGKPLDQVRGSVREGADLCGLD
jgi:hypothetical protein